MLLKQSVRHRATVCLLQVCVGVCIRRIDIDIIFVVSRVQLLLLLERGEAHCRLRLGGRHVTGKTDRRHVDDVTAGGIVVGDRERRRDRLEDTAVGALAMQLLLLHSPILKPRLHLCRDSDDKVWSK